MEWEPVQHVWIDHDNDLVDLTIGWTKHTKHGDVHEDETIHTNQKHPFLTVEAGFVPVSALNVGMHLVEGNGQIAIIEDWLVIAGSETMYNLTIQQDHTYTVGDGQFVVHNCGFDRSIKNLEELDDSIPGQLTKNSDVVDAGRSGGNRPLNGPSSSYSQTTGGHALVYDNDGKLIYDIDPDRVKMVKIDTNPNTGQQFMRDFKLRDSNGNLGVPPAWKSLLP